MKILTALFVFGLSLLSVDTALAALDLSAANSFASGDGKQEVSEIAGNLYEVLGWIAGIIAVIAGVVGGILFMSGKPELGTKILIGDIIGIVIVVAIAGIISFIGG